jgi:ABC-2 type transport system permease protein
MRLSPVLEDRSETGADAAAGPSDRLISRRLQRPGHGPRGCLLRADTVDAIVRVPVDFTARKAAGEGRIQNLLNAMTRPRR